VEDVSDIATRLREPAPSPLAYGEREAFIMNENERHEAADEIERLRAEVAEWKRATYANTPQDFILQVKADGERDD
jgi:hypothetical protein